MLELWGDIRVRGDDVRFGSKADIWTCAKDVRFTPESGHSRRSETNALFGLQSPAMTVSTLLKHL